MKNNSKLDNILDISNRLTNRSKEAQTYTQEISVKASIATEGIINSQNEAVELFTIRSGEIIRCLEDVKIVGKIKSLSNEISKISQSINFISLNASIEAARAGRSGEAFNIVAKEIKTLADSTRNIVHEIDAITEKIIHSVGELSTNTSEILKFIDEKVIKNFESVMGICEDYFGNAVYFNDMASEFIKSADTLNLNIESLIEVDEYSRSK